MSMSENSSVTFEKQDAPHDVSFEVISQKLIILSTTVLQPEAAEGLYDQAKAYQDVISDRQRLYSEVVDLRQQLHAREASLAKIEPLAASAQHSLNDIAQRLDNFLVLVEAEKPEIDFSETVQLQQATEPRVRHYESLLPPPMPLVSPKAIVSPPVVVNVGQQSDIGQRSVALPPATLSGERRGAVRDFSDNRSPLKSVLFGVGKSALRG